MRSLTIPGEADYAPRRMSAIDGVAAALSALRKRAGLSQAVVEQRAELSKGSLSRFERGEQHPRLETLGAVLDALGADLYDFGVEARKAAGREVPTVPDAAPQRLSPYHRIAEELGADARLRLDLMEAQQARLTLEVHSLREVVGGQSKRRGPEE